MNTEDEWVEEVKRLLRAEMARRGVTYQGLAERLAAIGVRTLRFSEDGGRQ